jgi:hypothetical protein
MRYGINNPADGGALHPGADLRSSLTGKIQCIVTVSECPEGVEFGIYFHQDEKPAAAEAMAGEGGLQDKEFKRIIDRITTN